MSHGCKILKCFAGLMLLCTFLVNFLNADEAEKKDPDIREALEIFFGGKEKPTPAKFYTDQFPIQKYHDAVMSILDKRIPKDEARAMIREYIRKSRQDAKWSYVPPEVKIPYAETPVRIDAVLDPAEWSHALTFKGQYPCDSMRKDPENEPVVRLLWNKTFLYISSEMKNSTFRKVGKQVYDADCLEMFIRIDRRLQLYWELIVNYRNELFSNYRSVNYWGMFADHQMPIDVFPGLQHKAEVRNGVFHMEIAIPWRLIPGFFNVRKADSPKPDETVMFNLIPIFTSSDNKTHHYSVFPLMYGGHNIHGQITGILLPPSGAEKGK